jgi:Protein of unknown function (DUF3307)
MMLLLKLLLAHLIGDFLLQPKAWVKSKEDKKLGAWQLYVHVTIHGVLVLLLLWNWQFWPLALVIMVVHLLIDAAKILLQTKNTKRAYFFLDQILHLLSIYIIWQFYHDFSFHFSINNRIILFFTAFFLLTLPTSMAIKMFIAKWTPDTVDSEEESLQSAGKYIGIFERLFVFAFIITNHWEAIGFLLAAKSVFRFGDLKEAKDRKLTEYILIGTLLSFGLSVLVGLIYMQLKTVL